MEPSVHVGIRGELIKRVSSYKSLQINYLLWTVHIDHAGSEAASVMVFFCHAWSLLSSIATPASEEVLV